MPALSAAIVRNSLGGQSLMRDVEVVENIDFGASVVLTALIDEVVGH
jgi:hypothetical protein